MNEEIAIIAPANIKYMPYIQNYIDILENTKQPYYIITWNKANIDEDKADYVLQYNVEDEDRKRMFLGYFKFSSMCKRIIRKKKTHKIIVLTAAPAFFMGSKFLKKGQYIIDIRDDSPFIKHFRNKFIDICKSADQVIVSSPNYNQWTGREENLLCHNVDMGLLHEAKKLPVRSAYSEPYTIVFAGMMNEAKANIAYLKQLGNDGRFHHVFFGRENHEKEKIVEYVKNEGMKNVDFYGTYEKNNILRIYRENACLVNIIREKCVVNKNALPNKLYDAVFSGVPVIVYDHNEAIASYVTKYSLGIVIHENELHSMGDIICSYFENFDRDKYADGRTAFIDEITEDMSQVKNAIENFAG